jgi:hypothetical protein
MIKCSGCVSYGLERHFPLPKHRSVNVGDIVLGQGHTAYPVLWGSLSDIHMWVDL